MSLSWSDFPTFYTEANKLIHPGEPERELYPWQKAMGEFIETHDGYFPETIIAPTGAGKTTGVYAHVFRAALDSSAPARFVHVTPRRSLVDQMYDEMVDLSEALRTDNLHPVLQEVKERLLARRLTLVDGTPDPDATPIITVARRGGMFGKRDREWMLDPHTCTVMTMTAHQAVSALLFKGYGTSLSSRSVEAGLLATNTTMVLDEAHTMRQAVSTARSVSRLMRKAGTLVGHPLEVVEMTATPSKCMDTEGALTVTEADYADPSLRIGKVLSSPKPVTVLCEGDVSVGAKWLKGVKGDPSKIVASETLRLHETVGRGTGGRTVGTVVNKVADALNVAQGLRAAGLTVVVITGRMRNADRDLLTGRFGDVDGSYPGVLTSRGNENVDVLVATQTIEIGVDINLAGMVTMVASADSLAQRFGRVNRGGEETPAPITVVVPKTAPTKGDSVYTAEEVRAAVEWLKILEDGNASTLAVSQSKPPVKEPRRAVIETLHIGDAISLSMVSGTRSFADEDVDLWISDDVVRRPETQVAIRRYAGELDALDRSLLLDALPVDAAETWVMGPSSAQNLLNCLSDDGFNVNLKAITLVNNSGSYDVSLNDDGNLSVDYGKNGFKELSYPQLVTNTIVLWASGDLPVTPEGEFDTSTTSRWISEENLRRNPHRDNGLRVHVLLGGEVPDTTSVDSQPKRWELLTDKVGQSNSFVTLPSDAHEVPAKWAVVAPWEGADQRRLSTHSPSGKPVLLDDHQGDVADTARKVSKLVGLDQDHEDAMYLAGIHHDDGKADTRFQDMLRNGSDASGVLAKSGEKYYKKRVDYRKYGMPQGWRHEQLSAALAYGRVSHEHRELITLLVGMSHGNGRSYFPHGIATLSPELPDDAVDIFTDGTWEESLHRMTRRYGPWGLAYLEALLRAADQTVSAQGH